MPRRPRKPKGPKTVFDKLNEKAPGFLDGVMSATNESLKDLIVEIELKDREIEDFKKKDSDLISLSQRTKTARETYSVPLTLNRLKRRAIAILLEERGKA